MQLNLADEAAYADAALQEESFANTAEVLSQPHDVVTLRRTGLRPVNFRGTVIAHGMSFRVGTPLWYEINIFSVASGGYVGDVRMFTKADGEQDKFTVHVASGLEDVVDFLENYNPDADLVLDVDLNDASMSLADLAMQAVSIRARLENGRAQYKSLASEIFAELDAHQSQNDG